MVAAFSAHLVVPTMPKSMRKRVTGATRRKKQISTWKNIADAALQTGQNEIADGATSIVKQVQLKQSKNRKKKRARENKKKAANASTATVAAAGKKIPGTMSKAATLAGPTVPKAQPVAVPTVPKAAAFGPPVHL